MDSNATCRQCACPDALPVEVVFNGTTVMRANFCSQCWRSAQEDFERIQEQYEELLDQGVHRKMANHIMLAAIDRLSCMETI
jgi:hypothetical protein